MKCLLCNFASNDSEDLKEHYLSRISQSESKFFINLFKRQNSVFRPRRCLRCDGFLLNRWFKVNHDFLVHYCESRDAFDKKPMNYTRLGKEQKYEIMFAQHSQNYDFYNFENLVDDICSISRVG